MQEVDTHDYAVDKGGSGKTRAQDHTLVNDASDTASRTPLGGMTQGNRDNEVSSKHWLTFLSLTSKDPEAARVELAKFVKSRYGQHPLAHEWMELTFRTRLDGKLSLPDTIRCIEIQIELLKHLGTENAEDLEPLQKSLKMFNKTLENVQRAGGDPKTIEVDFQFDDSPEVQSKEGE